MYTYNSDSVHNINFQQAYTEYTLYGQHLPPVFQYLKVSYLTMNIISRSTSTTVQWVHMIFASHYRLCVVFFSFFQITSVDPLGVCYFNQVPHSNCYTSMNCSYELAASDIVKTLPDPHVFTHGSRVFYEFRI